MKIKTLAAVGVSMFCIGALLMQAAVVATAEPTTSTGAAAYDAGRVTVMRPTVVVSSGYGHRPTAAQVARAQRVASNARGSSGNNGTIQFTAGCRRFTVINYETTPFGGVASKFTTWTDYCFHPKSRKPLRITNLKRGWNDREAQFMNFHGTSRLVFRKVDACHHKYYLQGTFTNDVPGPWPRVNRWVSKNMLVVTCVGTAHWGTDDYARPGAEQ